MELLMQRQLKQIYISTLIFLFVLSFNSLFAESAERVKSGVVMAIEGKVEALHEDEKEWAPLIKGTDVYLRDTVRTSKGSRLIIRFLDETMLNVAENSNINIDTYLYDPTENKRTAIFKLFSGRVRTITGKILRKESSVEIHTRTSIAGVRGSDQVNMILNDPAGNEFTRVLQLTGIGFVRNINPDIPRVIDIKPGTMSDVFLNTVPTPPVTIPPDMLKEIGSALNIRVKLEGRKHFVSEEKPFTEKEEIEAEIKAEEEKPEVPVEKPAEEIAEKPEEKPEIEAKPEEKVEEEKPEVPVEKPVEEITEKPEEKIEAPVKMEGVVAPEIIDAGADIKETEVVVKEVAEEVIEETKKSIIEKMAAEVIVPPPVVTPPLPLPPSTP
jgi:hypothetical protein